MMYTTVPTEGPWSERCRCDGSPLLGSDHCRDCFCEQYEERCEWGVNQGGPGPWQERSDSEKYGQLMRELREQQSRRGKVYA